MILLFNSNNYDRSIFLSFYKISAIFSTSSSFYQFFLYQLSYLPFYCFLGRFSNKTTISFAKIPLFKEIVSSRDFNPSLLFSSLFCCKYCYLKSFSYSFKFWARGIIFNKIVDNFTYSRTVFFNPT